MPQPFPAHLSLLIAALHAAVPDRLPVLRNAIANLVELQSLGASVAALQDSAERWAARAGAKLDLTHAHRVVQWLDLPDHHLVVLNLPGYPPALASISNPPPVLFVAGQLSLLDAPQLAIVGSRRSGAVGRQIAKSLAGDLARAGLVITSGLASGVDAAAHQGALEANGGTIAVLGNGIDVVYPPAHQALAAQVASTGALVSEFPLGTRPARHSFPRRNRVISGLALGTLVVEAALGSGSLITAREALEQGREVFAVPGSILNPLAAGPHWLIRQGAKLVESAVDVLEELPACAAQGSEKFSLKTEHYDISTEAWRVLEALGFEPTSFDSLVSRSGLTPPEVSSILTALDIQGLVRAETGGKFVLLRPVFKSA